MSFEFELTPLQNRLVAVALALLSLVAVFLIAEPALTARADHHDAVERLGAQASVLERLAAEAPAHERAVAALRSANVDDGLVFTGEGSLAAAQLQSQIAGLVVSSGGALTRSEVMPEIADGALMKFGLRITVEAEIAALARLLYDLDLAKPLIFVSRVAARDPDGEWASGPLPAPNRLAIDLVIEGYRRP